MRYPVLGDPFDPLSAAEAENIEVEGNPETVAVEDSTNGFLDKVKIFQGKEHIQECCRLLCFVFHFLLYHEIFCFMYLSYTFLSA